MTRPAANAATSSAASAAVEWGEELLATPERRPKIGGKAGRICWTHREFLGIYACTSCTRLFLSCKKTCFIQDVEIGTLLVESNLTIQKRIYHLLRLSRVVRKCSKRKFVNGSFLK